MTAFYFTLESHITMICKLIIIIAALQINNSATLRFVIHPDRDLSITSIFAKYGYPTELHEFVTQDGYILKMHRIPRGKNNVSSELNNQHPVIMVHGTCGCAENFIIAGAGKAITYYLADRGFDVWLLSTRGSRHSRKHKTLNPDTDKEFWNFGWHEVAVIDTPEAVDYILKFTNKSKLFYVGHSQGSTTYFAFVSDKPEYNNKISAAVTMAPACFLKDTRNFVKILSRQSEIFQQVAIYFNFHEFFPRQVTKLINSLLKVLCSETTFFRDICYAILYGGEVYGDMSQITPQFAFSTSPGHCSLKEIMHYLQLVHTGLFTQYDYGVRENLKHYGSRSPPSYSFANMTAPVGLFYAPNDHFCPKSGVLKLSKLLPNVARLYAVPSERFKHVDFIFGKRVEKLVNEQIYQLFKRYM